MIRAIALAAALGALAAAGALCGAIESPVRSLIAARAGAGASSAGPRIATEDWPLCSAIAAMGSEGDWAQLDPDFAAGKRALVAEDWHAAIAALKLAALREPGNADIQNHIGYAHHRLQQFGPAMQHYQQALVLNRRHRGAHEHLGKLYLVLGAPDIAKQHLAMLEEICLIPCVETDNLKRAVAANGAPMTR